MTTAADPILYGVPFSQPVRAVMWLMIYKRQPFDLVLINPGSKGSSGSRHPDYLARNPAGTIPVLEEPDTGFALGEAHAIMAYLCGKHAWHDVYPADLKLRARVDWYLHYHHRNVREGSVGFVGPRIRKDIEIPEIIREASCNCFTNAVRLLDTSVLAEHRYIAGDNLSIADFAAYVEIGQTRAAFTNLFDFAGFPNVARWLDDMTRVAGHDEVHVALTALGDISREPPSMDAIRSANKRAFDAVRACIASLRQLRS